MRHLLLSLSALLLALTLALPQGHIAMAATQDFTLATNIHLKSGVNTFGGASGFSVPPGTLVAIIDTSGVNPADTFTFDIKETFDSGTDWTDWGAITFSAAPWTDKTGAQRTDHNFAGSWAGGGMDVIVTSNANATVSISATLDTP